MFVFPYFSRTIEIHFPNVLGIVWISVSTKNLTNLWISNVCFFLYFSRTMEVHFTHVLGIVSISASSKIFEKDITLECLSFPILLPYSETSLSPRIGNDKDFCFTQIIHEIHTFEMFVFSHNFLVSWKSTFFMFWELYGFLFHPKYLRNP